MTASLARPGGNLTGLTWDTGPEMFAKSLELVKEVLPGMARVGGLWNVGDPADPDNPASLAAAAAFESGARQLKLAFHLARLRRPEELPGALAAIERERVDALVWCLTAPFREQPLLDFVARQRLPSVGCWRGAVAAGALMSYAPSGPTCFAGPPCTQSSKSLDRPLPGTPRRWGTQVRPCPPWVISSSSTSAP